MGQPDFVNPTTNILQIKLNDNDKTLQFGVQPDYEALEVIKYTYGFPTDVKLEVTIRNINDEPPVFGTIEPCIIEVVYLFCL